MSVTRLPHAGEHVTIDIEGRQTIFGWIAYHEKVRPPAPPDKPYQYASVGWLPHNQEIVETVEATVRAYSEEREESDEHEAEGILVSPGVAAHLRAAGVYNCTNLLQYTYVNSAITTQTAEICVRIPLSYGSLYDIGINFIEITPIYEGCQLADNNGYPLT